MRFPMHLDVANALGWTFPTEPTSCLRHNTPIIPVEDCAFYFVMPMDDIVDDDWDEVDSPISAVN